MNAPVREITSSRRAFIVSAVGAGGALLVGCSPAEMLSLGAPKLDFGAFGPFIRIDPDGSVTVVNKHIEFGQGSHAGLAAIVAEEMDADWDKVKIVQAPANAKVYGNLQTGGVQGTGGSSAIANSWDQLRLAGAAARAMFVQAAAARLAAPAAELSVKDSVVSHAKSGRQATFAELLTSAGKITPPQSSTPKSPADFTLIGTDRVRRKDAVAKSTGTARFTQDVHLPNMLTAMVAHPTKFGAKPKSFDDTAARKVPGVVDVFQIPSGVAVVANDTWSAKQGREALKVEWDEAEAETRGSDVLLDLYRRAAASADDTPGIKWQPWDTRPAPTPPATGPVVAASYDFPFLAHAPMEPMNCVAEIGGGKLKLTFGSQVPTIDQLNTALIVGALPAQVEVEQLFAGGSFGRRANFKSDYVSECVHIAKHVGGGRPVKLVWTREDDMTGGYYRPLAHHRLEVQLAADGLPHHWFHRVVTQSIMKGSPVPSKGLDESAIEGTKDSPYLVATPYVTGEAALIDLAVPVLWWRSVGATHNAFVMEHTVDQLDRKSTRLNSSHLSVSRMPSSA
jgi:isoquinoline 1-oxidoreductase beta subunit